MQDVIDLGIVVVSLVFVIWIIRSKRLPVRFYAPGLIDCAVAAAVGIALLLLMALILQLTPQVGNFSSSPLKIATIVFLTPLIEELIFRGILIEFMLLRGFRIAIAVLISSTAFALIHLHHTAVDYFILFAGGLVLSTLYLWRRNIALPFTAHAIINALVLLFGGK